MGGEGDLAKALKTLRGGRGWEKTTLRIKKGNLGVHPG